MKQILLKTWLILVCLLTGAGTMWATDVINNSSTSSKLGNTATSSWVDAFDLTLTSGAVVNVRSMGTKSTSNALQWNANGYLYMKTSGGKLKSVTIKGASKTVNVYASNTAYSAAPSGTALGTISVTSTGATYNFTSDYTYLALKGTASSTSITEITIEYETAPTVPYTVTFNAGSNGSCPTTSLTETSVGAGVTLPSCTANTNYTFVGWSTSSTPTSANAGKAGDTYKPSSNCTLYAYYTYQAPSHDAKFFVNGQQYGETQSVAEGSAITFPAENPSIDDVVFIGWAEREIAGTQQTAPTLVSSKNMGDTDANFYAVFASADGEETTETFGWEEATTPSNWKLGGTFTRTAASDSYAANSGDYYGLTSSNSSVQFAQKVKVKSFSYYCVRRTTNTNTSIKIETSTNGTTWTEALSTTWNTFKSDGKTYTKIEKTWDEPIECYVRVNLVTAANRQLDDISITYGDVTYSDYCTTVSAKATATLSIADADKNVALGYNGTKDVTISVNEAEYDGTLTVASSDDKVATVTYTGTTATINYVGEGEAYISVTAPSTANYYAINAPLAIKVTATDDRQVATVTIDPATISVDNGASADYTITTAYEGTISVASDKTSVATVSYNAGKVTVNGVSVGTATLTISGEGNENYKPFSKDFTITVNKVVPVGIKNLRTQITSTNNKSQDDVEVKLVDAIVTYVSEVTGTATPTIYLEDAEAGIVIYAKNTNLVAGDKLNGVITGKGFIYNGLTELGTIVLTNVEKTTGATVPCNEITLAQLEEDGMEAWESRRVIVKGLSITSEMSNRNATVEQNGTSFTIREGANGCTGEKLSSTDNGITSVVGYFQDYNTATQFNVWSEGDITLADKAVAQVVFNLEAGTGTNESPVAFTIGEDNTFPTAVVKDSEGNAIAGATVTYSTGNDAYISVDAETGVVTLKKYASKSYNVHVTATFAGNAEYKSATADYYLTIAKGQPVISFAQPNVEVALDGTANLAAIVDAKYGSLAVTYTSSNPAVASFADANNSTLTLNAEGTTTISAKTVGNDAWNQSDKVTYTLTVTAPVAGYAYVTLDGCGNDVEGYTEPLKVVKGRTVTLPAATTTKDEYTFLGWTSKEVTKTSTAPVLEDNEYVANADVTLYPVFSKEESDGSSDTEIGWVLKGLNELDLNETVLIISTSGTTSKILSADQGSTGYFTGRDVTVEDGFVTSNEPANSDWIISKEGDNYSFTSNNNGYLYNMGCSYSNYERWALSANGEKTYSMESLGGSPYNHSGSYVYLNNNTWDMTTDASLSKIQFFQVDEYNVPGSTTTYYVSRTMNILELNEDATEIAEIHDEYDKVIVHRTIKAGNWNTLCLPFAMNATQIAENFGSDAEVKILAGLTVNGESYTMHFEDCDEIDAALPCMIRVSSPVSTIIVEGNVMVNTVDDAEDSANDSSEENLVTFVGSYAKTTVPMNEGNYIISSNKFYYVDSAVTNKGFRGYFNLFSLDANSSRKLSFDFGGTITDIENVNIEGLDDNIFDLQGRRVQRFQKGVNIVNGRKVIR